MTHVARIQDPHRSRFSPRGKTRRPVRRPKVRGSHAFFDLTSSRGTGEAPALKTAEEKPRTPTQPEMARGEWDDADTLLMPL